MLSPEKMHPLKEALYQESHSRPFPRLPTPCRVSLLVVPFGAATAEQERAHLCRLAQDFQAPTPEPGCLSYTENLGTVRVRWQRHGEFSSYAFFEAGLYQEPFSNPPLKRIPPAWMEGIPGKLLISTHLVVDSAQKKYDHQRIHQLFSGKAIVGSRVRRGGAEVWSSLDLHEDGCGRYLVLSDQLGEAQTGRVVQRLLELETYRILALLALPLARQISPTLNRMDYSLILVADQIKQIQSLEDEQSLLSKLTEMSIAVTELRAHSFRFGATDAYFKLAQEILLGLEEEKLAGHLTLGDFLRRRLTPAERTCRVVRARIEELAGRIEQASELLGTSISLRLEEQNQALLLSLDARGKLQLRLQEAVEGLSIAAISYYMVSLLKILLKGGEKLGLRLNAEIISAISIPVVLLSVWYGVHRIKERIIRNSP